MDRYAVVLDRYALVGLAGNPFATGEDEAWRASGPDRFVSRLVPDPPPPGSRTLVQVIGDRGAGKTTHLRRWQRIEPGPYHYIAARPYRGRWRQPPVGPIVYGDEIDRMPAPRRWRWLRALARVDATVVVGTHHDLGRVATAAGLLVQTSELGPVDRATLRTVVEARMAASALPSDQVPRVALTEAHIESVHRRCDGSIRTAEVLCHQLVAEIVDEFVDLADHRPRRSRRSSAETSADRAASTRRP